MTNQGTTAQAIYAAYGHANQSVSFLRDLQSRGFVEVLRHGKTGGEGINPLGNKDFMTWAPLLQREVTGADLSIILSNIAALDAMHQALTPFVPFSQSKGKTLTIQQERAKKPTRSNRSVSGGIQSGQPGKTGKSGGGKGGGRGKGGKPSQGLGNRPRTHQGGGDVQPSEKRCSFCRRPWCTERMCNPNGEFVKLPGNDGALRAGTSCWQCGQFGHRDTECPPVSYTHLTLPTKRIV